MAAAVTNEFKSIFYEESDSLLASQVRAPSPGRGTPEGKDATVYHKVFHQNVVESHLRTAELHPEAYPFINKALAEKLLSANQDGSFIIRRSILNKAVHTIGVSYILDKVVHHHQIPFNGVMRPQFQLGKDVLAILENAYRTSGGETYLRNPPKSFKPL